MLIREYKLFSYKMSELRAPNVQHGDYRYQDCIIYLKVIRQQIMNVLTTKKKW